MLGGAGQTAILIDRRFDEALDLVLEKYRLKARPGTSVPKIGHLLGVASLVIDDGGDADQAIAALLHDVPSYGHDAAAEVGERFGPRVERIVRAVGRGCEQFWRHRRSSGEEYVAGLACAPPESWKVSLADALSSARYVLGEVRHHGPLAIDGEAGLPQRKFQCSLVDVYAELVPGPLADELRRVVDEIELVAR